MIIHKHKAKENYDFDILLLIIPILAFGLILAIYLVNVRGSESTSIATSAIQTDVLGDETVIDMNRGN